MKKIFFLHSFFLSDEAVVVDCVANMGEIFHLLTETVDYHAFEPGLAGYKCLEKKLEK